MRKIMVLMVFFSLLLCSLVCTAGDIDEEELREKQAQVREKVERLTLAVLRRDHAEIAENSDYEGFSSSKGYKIDEFFEGFHGDHYNCAEIEIMKVEVFPGPTERAEATLRVHLAVTPPHDVSPIRIDLWEFENRRGNWLLILRK